MRQLSAPEMQGRESGTPGGDRAAAWLEARFRGLGLDPLFPGNSFRQRFPLVLETRPGPGNWLRVGGRARERGVDFAPFPFSASARVEAPGVFLGAGLSLPERGWDDLGEKGIRGKVAMILEEVPATLREEPALALRRTVRDRASRLVARGAAAVLVISPRSRGPRRLATRGVGRAGARLGVPVLNGTWELGEAWLRSAGKRLGPLARRAQRQPVPALLLPEVQLVTDLVERRGVAWNLGARIPGRDPGAAPVVIGAHYDHLGRGGVTSRVPGRPPGEVDRLHPGADDNASGVVAMLAVAEALASRRLPRSVLVLGFGAEEPGMLGSRYFLGEWLRTEAAPVVMLNLDMVGRLGRGPLEVRGVDTGGGLRDLVRARAAALGLPLRMVGSGSAPSDQLPFYTREIPVLYFFTGYHSDYHRPGDTWDRVDSHGLARVARLAGACLQELARSPTPPGFHRVRGGRGPALRKP